MKSTRSSLIGVRCPLSRAKAGLTCGWLPALLVAAVITAVGVGENVASAALVVEGADGSQGGTLSTSPAPPFLVQEAIAQTVPVGIDVTFTVVAGGTEPFAYQWRKDGLDLDGQSSPSLSLAPDSDRLGDAPGGCGGL